MRSRRSDGGGAPRRRSRSPGRTRIRVELWGVLDQALVSGVNFLTIILLARSLAPVDFGYFVLAFTILQTAGTLQASLITRPHNVLGAVRHGREYADYSTTAATVQIGLAVALALVALAAAGLAYAAGFSQAVLFLALAPALVAWQLQEFGRRMLYTGRAARRRIRERRRELRRPGGRPPPSLAARPAHGCEGASHAGRGVRSRCARRRLAAPLDALGRLDRSALSANWHFGKWLGVAEVGQWFSTQFYIYLAAAVIGAVASAALKASQTLLGPISVFLTFVTSYLPIVLAREVEASGSIRRKVRRSLTAILPVVVPYCVVIGLPRNRRWSSCTARSTGSTQTSSSCSRSTTSSWPSRPSLSPR